MYEINTINPLDEQVFNIQIDDHDLHMKHSIPMPFTTLLVKRDRPQLNLKNLYVVNDDYTLGTRMDCTLSIC